MVLVSNGTRLHSNHLYPCFLSVVYCSQVFYELNKGYLGKNALLVFVLEPLSKAVLGYGPMPSTPLVYYEDPQNNLANWYLIFFFFFFDCICVVFGLFALFSNTHVDVGFTKQHCKKK
jgi:hypothetical protein